MQERIITKLLIIALLLLTAMAVAKHAPFQAARGAADSANFNLTRNLETPSEFSLIITEGEERSVSGSFTVKQLDIIRAIIIEAKKFALTAEDVGANKPIITQFFEKQEPSFLIDVEKFGTVSRFYITFKTQIGTITVEAGTSDRNSKRETGLLFNLLSRLEAEIARSPKSAPR
jgi:hypothetical protein